MTSVIEFMANFISQLILIRAYCKLLDMRSNVVFGILSMTGMIIAIVVDALLTAPFFETVVMGPIVVFVLPVACSRGPLKQRVLRCTLALTTTLVSVSVVYLILSALLGEFTVEGSGYVNSTSAFIGSALSTVCMGFGTEVLLALVARFEKRKDVTLIPPFVLLLLWSYVISVICFTFASDKRYVVSANLSAVVCIYYALVLALCFASAAFFRGDVKTARHESQRTLTDEQSKIIRAEIDAATKRASNTRRLHHVLANKVATICELAERGDTHNAEAYLNVLRDQANNSVNASSDGPDTWEKA